MKKHLENWILGGRVINSYRGLPLGLLAFFVCCLDAFPKQGGAMTVAKKSGQEEVLVGFFAMEQAFMLVDTTEPLRPGFTQTIKGQVVDKHSGFPLAGVHVLVRDLDTFLGSSTDEQGYFRIDKVPVGRRVLEFTYLGYQPIVLGNLLLTSAKELELQVEMEERIMQLDEVVVTAEEDKKETLNPFASVSARTFSVEEAGRYSGSFNDPARMAQNYAGVSGASDDRNDIIIRGNSPTGVLWRMNGVDIPSPNHFATLGTTGGPISMLNINNLSNSDFMTSAWSADYGNALSGVFDLRLRNGNKDKREYLGQLGFNGFELGAEGPFVKGKRSSYMANFRYSTLEVFNKLGFNLGVGTAVPEYKDLTFQLDFPSQKAGRFALWGILGDSHILFEVDPEDSTNLFVDLNNSEFWSKTGMLGFSHKYFFSERTSSSLNLAATAVATLGTNDSLSVLDGSKTPFFGFDRKQYKLSVHEQFKTKFDARNTLQWGVMYDQYFLHMQDSALFNGQYTEVKFYEGQLGLQQAYVNWQHRFSDALRLILGFHQQYFLKGRHNSLEPRLGIKYKSGLRSSWNFGAGLLSQMQPIEIYFNQRWGSSDFPNLDLDFTKALHLVLGYDYSFGENMRFKAEVYYQYLYQVPVDTFPSSFSMLNEGADFLLTSRTGLRNNGTGYNTGLELTLERFFADGYYFLSTFSLFDSKYRGSDGILRNTLYNGHYVFNALGGKEFSLGKSMTLALDARFTYAGGRRYTPVLLEASQAVGREIRDEAKAFSEQYPDYLKVDFKISFRKNAKRITQEWAVDLTNLTNRKNIFRQTYNERSGRIETTYQRGFFPNLLYRILF